jgi:DNA polymerase III delta prime subunit
MSIYDADMEKTINVIQTANTSLQKMTAIFDKFQNATISDTELETIRQNASSFLSYDLPRLE